MLALESLLALDFFLCLFIASNPTIISLMVPFLVEMKSVMLDLIVCVFSVGAVSVCIIFGKQNSLANPSSMSLFKIF